MTVAHLSSSEKSRQRRHKFESPAHLNRVVQSLPASSSAAAPHSWTARLAHLFHPVSLKKETQKRNKVSFVKTVHLS